LVSADLGRFDARLKGRRVTGRVRGGRLVPYATRGEIDAGALSGRGLEILWVDDAADAFFLHVQGSGRVILDTGRVVRLGFANRNGHSYRSIGRELIRRGALPKHGASMWAIRDWIAANPDQAASLLAANPSYIFFRIIEGEGPIGAQGVPLTPERSLAVDTRFLPLGLPLWLDTVQPGGSDRPLRRLMVAQDTGSAIKGPVRGDFFWGYGIKAARNAGTMKSHGRYYLLIPKTIAP
jgi:membrane-bound lytic murein transglycosylase A